MKEKTPKADIIEQPKQGFNLHGYKHNYIFFFNSDRHLELIDFFNVCFNGECYNRFTFNNGTACHNQNNHDVI